MKNKELKMELENFKRKDQKCLGQLIILKTNQRNILPFMRLFWKENKATHHPMTSGTDVLSLLHF